MESYAQVAARNTLSLLLPMLTPAILLPLLTPAVLLPSFLFEYSVDFAYPDRN
jgi:hypothetical protein